MHSRAKMWKGANPDRPARTRSQPTQRRVARAWCIEPPVPRRRAQLKGLGAEGGVAQLHRHQVLLARRESIETKNQPEYRTVQWCSGVIAC